MGKMFKYWTVAIFVIIASSNLYAADLYTPTFENLKNSLWYNGLNIDKNSYLEETQESLTIAAKSNDEIKKELPEELIIALNDFTKTL